jgi:predicted NBD/HSP70 family sugar kinase
LHGTNQELGRPYNRRIVLEAVRRHAPISRAEIARTVGLTAQTVSTISSELQAAGIITLSRDIRVRRGQPAQLLSLNASGVFSIGVQLAPGVVRAAVVNLVGDIVRHREAEPADERPESMFAAVAQLKAALAKGERRTQFLGLGVAMPGPFGVEPMSFVGPTTLERLKGQAIGERIADKTGLPVFIGIDSATGALAERQRGAGRSRGNFFYLYFGEGLGGCYVGETGIMSGTHGNASEIGHVPLVPDGDLCPCGNRGCLERYISLDALKRWLGTRGLRLRRNALADMAVARHPALLAWAAEMAPLLRRAIVMIENIFDPECIVIGGMAPAALVAELIDACQPLLPSLGNRAGRTEARLLGSALGQDATLAGAGVLAIDSLLSPRGMLAPARDNKHGDCLSRLIEVERQSSQQEAQ